MTQHTHMSFTAVRMTHTPPVNTTHLDLMISPRKPGRGLRSIYCAWEYFFNVGNMLLSWRYVWCMLRPGAAPLAPSFFLQRFISWMVISLTLSTVARMAPLRTDLHRENSPISIPLENNSSCLSFRAPR